MRKVVLGGRAVGVDPAAAIGKGGEADVYALADGRALKLFKTPEHPDFANQPALQDAARIRLLEMQSKLHRFPAAVPPRVVAPQEIALDPKTQQVVGYAMPMLRNAEVLFRFGERPFRDRSPRTALAIVRLFQSLAATVEQLHAAGVVIGDFNDLNVLVASGAPHLIDADSMQFGGFLCHAYTERFLDPLLADRAAQRPALQRPYGPGADWYAFAAMLFRSLLLVDPFGGVFRPADAALRVSHAARPLRGITVMRPDVQPPKAAHRLDMLPDAVLEAFRRVFEGADRAPFPLDQLLQARWTSCSHCGLEHARAACPACRTAPPLPAAPPAVEVRGEVTATRVVSLRGVGARILAAAAQAGQLRWLALEQGTLRRENGAIVELPAPLRAAGAMWAGLDGDDTIFATRDALYRIGAGGAVETYCADALAQGGPASVATAHGALCWQEDGRLMRRGTYGPEVVGTVLRGQTRIWAGERLGFGVSRAGPLSLAFLFTTGSRGINDRVALPRARGQVVEELVAVGADRVWHLLRESAAGRLTTRCTAVGADGQLLATLEAADGDDSWLAGARSVVAAGPWLFAVTDDGVVRVGATNGRVDAVARYPDTAPFVGDPCELLVGADGLYVVTAREILRLSLGK